MKKQEFVKAVEAELVNRGYEVRVNEVLKNNGIRLSSIVIMKKESNVSPRIYMEKFHEDFESGLVTINDVVAEVIRISRENEIDDSQFGVSKLNDFNSMKSNITYKLVNAEMNQEFLESVPHDMMEDLAVVYYINISDMASATITNQMMKLWGIDEEELKKVAFENAPLIQPAIIQSMEQIIDEMMTGCTDRDLKDEYEKSKNKGPVLFVLSNENKNFGASTMLYPHILDDFAENIGADDIYILPSSIHECLLIAKDDTATADSLRQMVIDVNSTELERQDLLSNNVYTYSTQTKEIRIA